MTESWLQCPQQRSNGMACKEVTFCETRARKLSNCFRQKQILAMRCYFGGATFVRDDSQTRRKVQAIPVSSTPAFLSINVI